MDSYSPVSFGSLFQYQYMEEGDDYGHTKLYHRVHSWMDDQDYAYVEWDTVFRTIDFYKNRYDEKPFTSLKL